MSPQPVDRFDDTSLDEWMLSVPNELPVDAVGLWQIIPALRIDFGLYGDALEHAARQVIRSLIVRGAHPVQGSAEDQRWHVVTRFGDDPDDIVDGIIAE